MMDVDYKWKILKSTAVKDQHLLEYNLLVASAKKRGSKEPKGKI